MKEGDKVDLYLTIPAGGGSLALGGWGSIDAGRYNGPLTEVPHRGTAGQQ